MEVKELLEGKFFISGLKYYFEFSLQIKNWCDIFLFQHNRNLLFRKIDEDRDMNSA